MKITVIGSGYVGLVTAACLAEVGNHVVCLDLDAKKIENLKNGIIPIYEPGLEDLMRREILAERISFTTDVQVAIEHGVVQFITVGTPTNEENGSADLSHVWSVAESIGRYMNQYIVVVNKSTVPIGTADAVYEKIKSALMERDSDIDFNVVSNPEFLKEGAAIEDFRRPDRVVIGTDSDKAFEIMKELYDAFVLKTERVIRMSARSAELTKYAANGMLATRISYMNSLARLADKTGANIDSVRIGMGSDSRIGPSFLYAGCGYGGSCFPKDVKALIHTAREFGVTLPILDSVELVNDQQKLVLVEKIVDYFGNISEMKFAVWGLSFKPNTDDMREAPSGPIIRELVRAGAKVVCYDPVALDHASKIYQDEPSVSFKKNSLGTLTNVDALIITTEWKEFRALDWEAMTKLMKNPVIFDGRNMQHPEVPRKQGFTYFSIGRP